MALKSKLRIGDNVRLTAEWKEYEESMRMTEASKSLSRKSDSGKVTEISDLRKTSNVDSNPFLIAYEDKKGVTNYSNEYWLEKQ